MAAANPLGPEPTMTASSTVLSARRSPRASAWRDRTAPRDVRPLDAFERLAFVVGGSRRGLDPKRRERQAAAWRQNHGALDHVLELADVSRPRMVTERLPRLARDHIDAAIHARGKPADEVIDERVDVLRPLTEGRYRDREDVQAVVQIVTEAAPFDQ